jgi:hypothetical protein
VRHLAGEIVAEWNAIDEEGAQTEVTVCSDAHSNPENVYWGLLHVGRM